MAHIDLKQHQPQRTPFSHNQLSKTLPSDQVTVSA